jgi:hypothetical protein
VEHWIIIGNIEPGEWPIDSMMIRSFDRSMIQPMLRSSIIDPQIPRAV